MNQHPPTLAEIEAFDRTLPPEQTIVHRYPDALDDFEQKVLKLVKNFSQPIALAPREQSSPSPAMDVEAIWVFDSDALFDKLRFDPAAALEEIAEQHGWKALTVSLINFMAVGGAPSESEDHFRVTLDIAVRCVQRRKEEPCAKP